MLSVKGIGKLFKRVAFSATISPACYYISGKGYIGKDELTSAFQTENKKKKALLYIVAAEERYPANDIKKSRDLLAKATKSKEVAEGRACVQCRNFFAFNRRILRRTFRISFKQPAR